MPEDSWKKNEAHYLAAYKAGQWDSTAGTTNPFAVATLLDRASPTRKAVVDIACGNARAVAEAAAMIKQPWGEFIGVDTFAPALQNLAVPGGKGIVIAPLPEGLFMPPLDNSAPCTPAMADIVLCLFLLQDLTRDDGETMLDKIVKLVRPDGQLVFGLTVHKEKDTFIYRPSTALKGGDAPAKHKEIWAIGTLRQAFAARGFQIVDEIHLPTRHHGHIELYVRATWSQPDHPPNPV